jgi:tripartite-type tricarboxylate transporter receptor subunit TctC
MRRAVCLACSCVALGAADTLYAQTSGYPSRPVRFIVPFPAGGGTDLIARLIGKKLGERWNQTVVVDNRGGGNGIIGTALAARSPADGHTFVIINSSFVVLPLLSSDVPYDGLNDFTPVIRPAESPNIVVVKPDLPVQSIADLIRVARAKPAGLNFAEGGFGGPSHLAAELFNAMNGTRMARVSYKGTGPAMADLLGGHVDLMFATVTGVLSHVRSGKLRHVIGARRKGGRARGDRRQALGDRARAADGRGKRRRGLRVRELVWRDGAQGHAGRGGDDAARRDPRDSRHR